MSLTALLCFFPLFEKRSYPWQQFAFFLKLRYRWFTMLFYKTEFFITKNPFKNCRLLASETEFKTVGAQVIEYCLAGPHGFHGFWALKWIPWLGTYTSCEGYPWDSTLLYDSSFFLCLVPRPVSRDTLGLFSSSGSSRPLVSCREVFQSFLV